jgi:hypothetical protein
MFPQSWLDFICWCLCSMAVLAYLGAETMRSFATRVEERNAYTCLLHWLVQYGTNGQCPSFFCMDFFVLFVNNSFTLMLIFRSTVQSLLCHSNNMWQIRQCRCLSHDQRCRKCWVCCVCYHEVHLVVWLQKEKTYRPSYHGKDIRITLWFTFIRRWKHFSLELQQHRWHYWHKLHTVVYQ